MPLPLILAGAALSAGGYGLKKGFDANSDRKLADNYNNIAKLLYDNATQSLDKARRSTQSEMESLGKIKFDIYTNTLPIFVKSFKKIKNIDFKSNIKTDELSTAMDKTELNHMCNSVLTISEAVSGGVSALGAGGLAGLAAYGGATTFATASTGTAISSLSGAAATNATLAWFGGGSLATGGLGMAGGTVVLGGIIAGPVLAVGGMMLASKAEAAKHDAYSNKLKAEFMAEQMAMAEVKVNAIGLKFSEINGVLNNIVNIITPLLDSFVSFVSNNTNYASYSEQYKKNIYVLVSTMQLLKQLLDINILNDDGSVSELAINVAENSNELIEELRSSVKSVEKGN